MAKYLVQASYTQDGAKGLLDKGGSSRPDAVRALVQALGGSMESFYFSFGDYDAAVIVDLPDNVSASAVALAVNAAGGSNTKTTVLLTPEEVDQATQKAVDFTAPGDQATSTTRQGAASEPSRASVQRSVKVVALSLLPSTTVVVSRSSR